jgi:hypothetical protein
MTVVLYIISKLVILKFDSAQRKGPLIIDQLDARGWLGQPFKFFDLNQSFGAENY